MRRWTQSLISLCLWLASGHAVVGQTTSLEDLLGAEIEVASRYKQPTREAPASVTLVTREEIVRFGYRTLRDVLDQVPGFYTSGDRNYGYVGVRGFSRPTDYNSRIVLLLNGHPTNDNFYGSFGIDGEFGFNLDGVERLEIVRGPGSSIYGTGAVLAVINVVTRSAADVDGGEVTVEVGNHGRRQASAVVGKVLTNGVEMTASGIWHATAGEDLFFTEFDAADTSNGIARSLDWEDYVGGHLGFRYKGLQIQGYHSSRDKGIPTASFETIFNDPRSRSTDESTLFEGRYTFDLGPNRQLLVRGHLNDYHYDGVYPYEGSTNLDFNDSRWWGIESQLSWDTSPANRLVVGVEYQDHTRARYNTTDFLDDGGVEVFFDGDFPYNLTSIYLQNAYQIRPNLALTTGLRFDEFSDTASNTAPRIALVYHPRERMTLKVLYNEAFRRPNHFEFFFDDGFNIANTDLVPEEIQSSELVWEHQLTDILAFNASIYRYEIDNVISGVELEDGAFVQFQNLDRATSTGVELKTDFRLPAGIWGYASYAFQETKDGTRQQLSNSPQHIGRMGISLPISDSIFVGGQLRYESERTTFLESALDDYLLLDLHLTTDLLLDRYRFWLHMRNATDERYSNPGGFEHGQEGIEQPGRTVRGGVAVRF